MYFEPTHVLSLTYLLDLKKLHFRKSKKIVNYKLLFFYGWLDTYFFCTYKKEHNLIFKKIPLCFLKTRL